MAKYEAEIRITAEVDVENIAQADELFLGELTKRLKQVANIDNRYKIWAEVIEIREVEN